MTDGIGRILGGNSYSIGGYGAPGKEETPKGADDEQPTVINHEETQVDPSKVMEFLANNNFFIAPAGTTSVGEVGAETKERIEISMENFEMIYGVIVEEFGEELAPFVMDVAMDYLMGMAA